MENTKPLRFRSPPSSLGVKGRRKEEKGKRKAAGPLSPPYRPRIRMPNGRQVPATTAVFGRCHCSHTFWPGCRTKLWLFAQEFSQPSVALSKEKRSTNNAALG